MDEVRFDHCLPYLSNGSYDIVLNIQLPPTSIERITIVMSTGDFEPLPSADITDSFRQQSLDQDVFSYIRTLAAIDAEQLARADLDIHDPAPESDLGTIAGRLAYKHLQESDVRKMIKGLDVSKIRQVFFTSFIDKYQEVLESGGMSILDRWREAIYARVRIDKEKDQNDGILLSNLEITCRAAIHEHEQSYSDKRCQPDYLPQIAKSASLYLETYRQLSLEKKVEWRERLDRAGIFLE